MYINYYYFFFGLLIICIQTANQNQSESLLIINRIETHAYFQHHKCTKNSLAIIFSQMYLTDVRIFLVCDGKNT